ncbi:MAG TPA: TPM domain-containing protein [Pyrinomonadaceae bacterium]|jgi:uncharacterized protein|nr:TPM domain-containing protein [Pyrinomonadaceae bacterium]
MTRKFSLTVLFTAATLLIAAFSAFSQTQPWSQNTSPLPAPTGFVNDYAGVIDAATKQQLETKLKNLRDTTSPSVEIGVAVVKTTGDRDIFDYSLAVARGWKIGSKEDDNPSALLFVAIDDRKYFSQVSKDLEDELPDGLVGSLQRQYLVPEFKKGNYAKGISDTVDAYINAIRNKGNTAAVPTSTPRPVSGGTSAGGSLFGAFCCGIVILIILLAIFSRGNRGGPTKKDGDRWGGGPFGGSGGGGVSSALPWIIGGLLSGGSGGSSSSSGGSSWGGSSDGGGFGGFGGGGDFGGGGSGGSW